MGDKSKWYVESAGGQKASQLSPFAQEGLSAQVVDRVNEACKGRNHQGGYIKCRTKGGMIVDVFGIEAFLPGSQIDVKPIRDYDAYVDKTMEFKVVRIQSQEFRNVVVSQRRSSRPSLRPKAGHHVETRKTRFSKVKWVKNITSLRSDSSI